MTKSKKARELLKWKAYHSGNIFLNVEDSNKLYEMTFSAYMDDEISNDEMEEILKQIVVTAKPMVIMLDLIKGINRKVWERK